MAGPGGQTRPMGVTILAILALIGGVAGLFGGLTVTVLGGVVSTVSGSLGGIVVILGILLLALSVVELAVAYGFWTLKPWAWQLGFVLEVAAVALAVLQVLFGGLSFANVVVTIVVAGIVLYYLNTPDVRKAFGAPDTGFPFVGNIGQR